MQPLITLEMNEVCLDYIQHYIDKGLLGNFKNIIEKHGITTTTSEINYEDIEPWIQWVSARTGLDYNEHGVFRLGDITKSKAKQHWEYIEEAGYSVAACSPINGANRTKRSKFWIPDPWVNTPTSGNKFIQDIATAVKAAVNENASEKVSVNTLTTLLKALLAKSSLKSLKQHLTYLLGVSKKQHWSKALILDRLLSDVFFNEWKKEKPDFSTLFLNSAAHIQHHYLFNSSAYNGTQNNPAWYITKNADPILEIYRLYDSIIEEALSTGARILICTGLSQVPYEKTTFYYRLKKHSSFLSDLNINFCSVEPRMSRDFLVSFDSDEECTRAEEQISNIKTNKNELVFNVDNRGDSLFITLSYPNEVTENLILLDAQDREITRNFKDIVDFVAIKNGHHDPHGFLIDTQLENHTSTQIKIEDLFEITLNHFSIKTRETGKRQVA